MFHFEATVATPHKSRYLDAASRNYTSQGAPAAAAADQLLIPWSLTLISSSWEGTEIRRQSNKQASEWRRNKFFHGFRPKTPMVGEVFAFTLFEMLQKLQKICSMLL